MVKNEVLTIARKYADAVRGIMNVREIFLYGSQAKGTATPDSDIDIAVVVDIIPDNYLDTLSRLWRLAWSVSLDIEPVLLSNGDSKSGFLQAVQNTGVAV